eukprot:4449972-Amphidinium_carterae.1
MKPATTQLIGTSRALQAPSPDSLLATLRTAPFAHGERLSLGPQAEPAAKKWNADRRNKLLKVVHFFFGGSSEHRGRRGVWRHAHS